MSLYEPPQFRMQDAAIAAEIMRTYPFATLVTTDDEGLPFATHLPVHAEEQGGSFLLWCHCARPNPQWRHLEQRPNALVMFMGPHAYQSPKIYPDLARVPSWNYIVVHCRVQARLVTEADEKDALLKRLIGDHEPAYAQQWRDLGEEYQKKMMAGITGLALTVTDWSCKVKLNQHRPESHVAMKAAYAAGNPDERALAEWMDRLGLDGPKEG